MKKLKFIFAPIAAMLICAALMTVLSYAWFASAPPSVEQFEVSVSEGAKIDKKFYRDYNGDGIYEKVAPSAAFVNGELMYPGKAVYCRIDVTNKAEKAINLSVSFTGINYSLLNAADGDVASLAEIAANFVLEKGISATETSPSPMESIRILEDLGVPQTADYLNVFERITLAPAQTLRLFYSFRLLAETGNFEGDFSLSCGGIRFTAG